MIVPNNISSLPTNKEQILGLTASLTIKGPPLELLWSNGYLINQVVNSP